MCIRDRLARRRRPSRCRRYPSRRRRPSRYRPRSGLVMMVYPAGLDAIEVDALQTDRYLDALLSAVDRRAYDVPADPAVDPTLRLAARQALFEPERRVGPNHFVAQA